MEFMAGVFTGILCGFFVSALCKAAADEPDKPEEREGTENDEERFY